MKIKILQWNVLYKEDIRKVRDFIKSVDPDICCLQEMTMDSPEYNDGIDTANYLAQNLGMFAYSIPGQKYDDAGEMCNAIISKYEPGFTRNVYLINPVSENPAPGTSGHVYIEAMFDIEGNELNVATTHLTYVPYFEEKPFKRQEWNHLENEIFNQKRFVFSGDLNAPPTSTIIKELDENLKSAGPEYSQNTWTTRPFEMHGFAADSLDYRLDYVYTSDDIEVVSSKILETKVSDHLPILTEIEL